MQDLYDTVLFNIGKCILFSLFALFLVHLQFDKYIPGRFFFANKFPYISLVLKKVKQIENIRFQYISILYI